MMPKTLYRYSQEQRKQKPADILATDSGFQSNEVYLTFVQNLMKKGKKSTAENLFRKTLQILKQKTKNSENVFVESSYSFRIGNVSTPFSVEEMI